MRYKVITYGRRWAVVDITHKDSPEILWLFDEEEQARRWVTDQMRAGMSL